MELTAKREPVRMRGGWRPTDMMTTNDSQKPSTYYPEIKVEKGGRVLTAQFAGFSIGSSHLEADVAVPQARGFGHGYRVTLDESGADLKTDADVLRALRAAILRCPPLRFVPCSRCGKDRLAAPEPVALTPFT